MQFVPVIKPVGGSCNLHCAYCYFRQKEGGKTNTTVMGDGTLRSLIDATCGNQKTVEFIWHGGEPLLAGIDFYHQVLEHESSWFSGEKRIYNSIQTNGTLVDERWVDFFSSNNFAAGVSLDGPAQFHDRVRGYRDGKGSFKKTMEAIHLLKEGGVLSDIICCISSVNCDFPDSIFDFFIAQGIKRLKFLQVQGRDQRDRLLPCSITGEQYANFLIGIFKKWLKLDDPEVEIREIKSIVNLMLGGNFRECMFAGECYKYFTVYPDGSIYGCDSLPKVESMRFGHISEGLKQLEISPNFIKFRQRMKELKKKCASCEWFHICRGGCLQDWWPDIFNPKTRNLFCEGLKKIFTTLQKALRAYRMI